MYVCGFATCKFIGSVFSSACSVAVAASACTTTVHAMQGKLFVCVLYIYVFPLCFYLCLRASMQLSASCRGFKCPSACPGTSVGWFLHKWNAAVD